MRVLWHYGLVACCGAVLGLVAVWWFVAMPDTPLAAATTEAAMLRVQLEKYRHLPELPQTQVSWEHLKQYVATHADVQLFPLNDEQQRAEPQVASILTDKRGGVLSGDSLKVFSIAKNIQTMMPVYFHRISIESHPDKSLTRLSLYVLGRAAVLQNFSYEEER